MTVGIIAVSVGAAASIYGAYSNSRNASAARDQQQRMYDGQMATAQENQQYYRTRYGPLESKLLGYATSDGYSPDYGKALGTLTTQFANTRRNTMSQNAGYGYSGLNRGQALGLDIEKGKAIAGLGLQDDINKRQVGLQLLNHDRSFDATQGLSNAQGAQGDRAGQSAAGYSQAAQAGWANVGTGLSGLATYLSSRQNPDIQDLMKKYGGNNQEQLPTQVNDFSDQIQPFSSQTSNGYGGYGGTPAFDSALGGAPDPYGIPAYGDY